MKIKLIFIFFIFTSFAFGADAVYNNVGENIYKTFEDAAATWYPTLAKAGAFLLGSLTVFQIVYVYSNMMLDGKFEPGAAMAQLIKIFFVFGLFYGLIVYGFSVPWFTSFLKGIAGIADDVSGHGKVDVDTLFEAAADVWSSVGDAKVGFKVMGFSVVDGDATIGQALAAIFTALLISFMLLGIAITFVVAQIKAILLVFTTPLWMGFAVFEYTKQWAINSIIAVIKVAAELFFLKLIVILAIDGFANDVEEMIKNNDGAVLLIIKGAAFFSLAKMSQGFVDAVFSGNSVGNASGAGQALKSAVAGAVGLAVGGVAGAKVAMQAANASTPGETGASKTTKASAALVGAASGAVSGLGKSFGVGRGGQGFAEQVGSTAGKTESKVQEMGQKWSHSLSKPDARQGGISIPNQNKE